MVLTVTTSGLRTVANSIKGAAFIAKKTKNATVIRTSAIIGLIRADFSFARFFICSALAAAGAFNAVYLAGFFKTGYKAGVPVIKGLIAFFLVYAAVEGLCFVPAVKAVLDGIGGDYLRIRAIVFVGGAAIYAGLSVLGVKAAQKRFEKVSL